jgi:hypothetical protein
MERNDDSLSTRDLAPSDPPVRTVADPDPRAAAEQTDVPDRAPAPAADRDQAPVPAADRDQAPAPAARNDLDASAHSGTVATQAPATGATADAPHDQTGDEEPLLDAQLSTDFQLRWEEVQTRFVDEPRGAVEDADGLVANVMQQLAEGFAQERERLEAQWGRGEDISTEDLRVALQRYRSFFRRLLST